MSKKVFFRIVIDLMLLVVLFLFPYWLSLIIAVIATIFFPYFIELVILSFFIDSIYSADYSYFLNFHFTVTLISIFIFFATNQFKQITVFK
jgi:hypothetical protein